MKLVYIESPYAGDVEANEAYLRECIKDSLERAEAPFASHGFYTRFLDDTKPEDRQLGMACGFEWLSVAELQAVYTDRGISLGMHHGIKKAQDLGIPTEYRKLGA